MLVLLILSVNLFAGHVISGKFPCYDIEISDGEFRETFIGLNSLKLRNDELEGENFNFSSNILNAYKSNMTIRHKVDCGRLVKGGVYCLVNCQQYKLVDESGCCRCHCELGFILNSDKKSCSKTKWTTWSAWSTCIKSPWGGLQTRERICKSGKLIATGRCIGRGSQSRSCCEKTKPLRVRKNIRHLNERELHDILQALTKFKKDKSNMGYHYITKWHGWPFICHWNKHLYNHEDGHCAWHAHPLFLAWHRLHIVQLELGLHRYLKDKTLGIPYWDWTEAEWNDLPDIIGKQWVFDPILKRKIINPLFRTYVEDHCPFKNKTVYNYRQVNFDGLHNYKLLLRTVIRAMNMPTFASMDTVLEDAHNQIHNCMCPGYKLENAAECFFSMKDVSFASFEPMFFIHHSQIDRLLSLYKTIHDKAGDQDWTKSSFVNPYAEDDRGLTFDIKESFDWPISPFCNKSINPSPITENQGVWTNHKSFYYKELFGYTYDTFNIGGKSWWGLVKDWKNKQKDITNGLRVPFISHAAPSSGFVSHKATSYNQEYGCKTP